jgi:hypothetical protein
MSDEPAKTTLTPIEARRKFKALLGHANTYKHFLENGGEWRPELHNGELAGYRWSRLHRTKTRWRRR